MLSDKPHIIVNKKIKVICFDFKFFFEYDNDKKYQYQLLEQMVNNGVKAYPTTEVFNKALLQNMIVQYRVNISHTYHQGIINFTIIVPNPKVLSSFDLEDAFKFFIDCIYNPNVIDNEFNNKCFIREQKYLLERLKHLNDSLYNYGYYQFLDVYDEDDIYKTDAIPNIDKLKKVNSYELYDLYTKIVLNNRALIHVYGNVLEEEIWNLFKKYYPYSFKEFKLDYKTYCYGKVKKEVCQRSEQTTYKQSVLYLGYKVEDMHRRDLPYFQFFRDVMSKHPTNLLFNLLRTDKNLIYSCHSSGSNSYGAFYIEIYLQKEKKEEIRKAIDEVFAKLQDRDFLEETRLKHLKGLKYDLIRDKSSQFYKLNYHIDKMLGFKSLNDIVHDYQRLDIDKFQEFVKRIKLDTIYYLEGEE